MNRKDIIGSWSLESFEIKRPTGDIEKWGSNPQGLLIYADDGKMSVAINSQISAEEKDPAAILKSVLFYSGDFEVSGSRIIHHVTQATDPQRIGKELIRDATLNDTLLTLTGSGGFGTAIVRWRKI
jgi:Lipocalin-like domain